MRSRIRITELCVVGSVVAMAELKATLHADMNAAMKARDELTTATLRMALAAVTTEEVAGKCGARADRRRGAAGARQGGEEAPRGGRGVRRRRTHRAGRPVSAPRLGVLERYLPSQLCRRRARRPGARRHRRDRRHRPARDGRGDEDRAAAGGRARRRQAGEHRGTRGNWPAADPPAGVRARRQWLGPPPPPCPPLPLPAPPPPLPAPPPPLPVPPLPLPLPPLLLPPPGCFVFFVVVLPVVTGRTGWTTGSPWPGPPRRCSCRR